MFPKIFLFGVLLFSIAMAVNGQVTPCDASPYKLKCEQQTLDLAGTPITVKVYTKAVRGRRIDRTFVVVHANERKGLDAAKQVIAETYGRLVEVVTNYQPGFAAKDPGNE